jgi:hypothetical protein
MSTKETEAIKEVESYFQNLVKEHNVQSTVELFEYI